MPPLLLIGPPSLAVSEPGASARTCSLSKGSEASILEELDVRAMRSTRAFASCASQTLQQQGAHNQGQELRAKLHAAGHGRPSSLFGPMIDAELAATCGTNQREAAVSRDRSAFPLKVSRRRTSLWCDDQRPLEVRCAVPVRVAAESGSLASPAFSQPSPTEYVPAKPRAACS